VPEQYPVDPPLHPAHLEQFPLTPHCEHEVYVTFPVHAMTEESGPPLLVPPPSSASPPLPSCGPKQP
jgi:hypothetical protein